MCVSISIVDERVTVCISVPEQTGSSFKGVTVAEVFNPRNFWIIVNGNTLSKLMDEIGYSNRSGIYNWTGLNV